MQIGKHMPSGKTVFSEAVDAIEDQVVSMVSVNEVVSMFIFVNPSFRSYGCALSLSDVLTSKRNSLQELS